MGELWYSDMVSWQLSVLCSALRIALNCMAPCVVPLLRIHYAILVQIEGSKGVLEYFLPKERGLSQELLGTR